MHGSPRYRAPRSDDELLVYLDSIYDLVPLHNHRAAAGRSTQRPRPFTGRPGRAETTSSPSLTTNSPFTTTWRKPVDGPILS